jgi:hypothetical protein
MSGQGVNEIRPAAEQERGDQLSTPLSSVVAHMRLRAIKHLLAVAVGARVENVKKCGHVFDSSRRQNTNRLDVR